MSAPAAVIAVGSNSTRMLCARVENGRLTHCERDRRETRLMLGTNAQGELTNEALARAVADVCELYKAALTLGALRVDAYATSAVRDAVNKQAFIDGVYAACGLRVRVISGQEEASLGFIGVAGAQNALVCDIGGGSCELAAGQGGVVRACQSAQMGASRLWKLCPVRSSDDARKATALALEQIAPCVGALQPIPRDAVFYGVGGSCTTLADIENGEVMSENTEGYALSFSRVCALTDQMAAMTTQERAQMPGMRPSRADIAVTGACVLRAVMDALGRESVTVSRRGNSDGYLLRYMNQT